MKTTDFIKEDFVTDAVAAHQDHEVQMARSDCYNAAKYAIELHKLLKHISEEQGLEGWVSEKITLANDYLRTVHEYLTYEQHSEAMPGFDAEVAEMQIESVINEVNPHDYDSDEDYYAALKAPVKQRSSVPPTPGVNPDDEDYFREIWRKNKLAKQKAEQDKQQDVTEGEQQKGADYRDPKEADYGDDYQQMVLRLKKLAGAGPLKTVYDPNKRVYKNIPTAVQPRNKK